MINETAQPGWVESNQLMLIGHLDRIRALLENPGGNSSGADRDSLRDTGPGMSAIAQLVSLFDLSDFERDILLLCAGVELDSRIADLCTQLTGGAFATFQVACATLPGAHWTAILPHASLRRWFLVDFDTGRSGVPLVEGAMRISERVLHHLTGVFCIDEAVRPLVRQCQATGALLPSHETTAERLSSHLLESNSKIIMLTGVDPQTRRHVATTACARLGARLYSIEGNDIRNEAGERDLFARLWEREARLAPVVLMIESDSVSHQAATALAEHLATEVIFSAREARGNSGDTRKAVVRIDLPRPPSEERRAWWARGLGDSSTHLNGTLDALAAQFDLGPLDIETAISSATAIEPEALWEACRLQARVPMDELAERIEARARWEDIVLPAAQIATLRQINAHMRQRLTVFEKWGFGSPGARGLGMSALFAGPSGTGKTMAAELLATELKLDLFRIDLSQVVSKYVGETEKNLRRVFQAAEHGGVILLFDEADALFGKRSEVKDSHDRYANIEISYLLQQMESYRGLAILTTNQRSALDTAFLRRLRFIVDFPFPDFAMRTEIWRRVFPDATPTSDLEPSRLARLSLPGGNIRNIALNAAFLAADEAEAVGMRHILAAARSEYAKLEKPLTEAETLDWIA